MDWYYSEAGAQKGPVTHDALLELFKSRAITTSTLVWNSTFGTTWKSFQEVEPEAVSANIAPPPLPEAAHAQGTDTIIPWLIAASPLLSPLIDRILGDMGVKNVDSVGVPIFFIMNVILVSVDLAKIKERNLNPQGRNIGAFLLFMPSYLFRRAAILKQAYWYAGAYLVVWAVVIMVATPGLFNGTTYMGFGTPQCESTSTKNMATDLGNQLLAPIGAKVVVLENWSEVSFQNKVRSCNFNLRANNTIVYPMMVTITPQDDQFLYNVQGR